MRPAQNLLKHSSIYAIGQILSRIASVLLLPLYTNCLTPADYGVTAIIDLTLSILSLMIGSGMVTAVTRYHFDEDSREWQDCVWWTGLTWLIAASTVVLLPLWFLRGILAELALGPAVENGSRYVALALATVFVQIIGQLLDGYLRVLKWSGISVMLSLCRLVLNVGLNVWFLAFRQLGIEGLLLGNLLTSFAHTAVLLLLFQSSRGRYQFNMDLARNMLRFSTPLVGTAVLCMLMHEADRYYLRFFVSLDQVGVYALAHKVAFSVNTLCLLPFSSIWAVEIYELAKLPESDRLFARIFGWFVSGMSVLLLGAALTVHPILPMLTPEAYGAALDLIAVILLGFLMFGLQLQFEVPALLARRTGLLMPGSVAGVLVSIVGNSLVIPHLGIYGAAWTTVLTYSVFSFTTLFVCRNLHPIPYPWRNAALTAGGCCLSYLGLRFLVFPAVGPAAQLLWSVVCCGLWSLILFGRTALTWWAAGRIPITNAAPACPPKPVTAQCELVHQ